MQLSDFKHYVLLWWQKTHTLFQSDFKHYVLLWWQKIYTHIISALRHTCNYSNRLSPTQDITNPEHTCMCVHAWSDCPSLVIDYNLCWRMSKNCSLSYEIVGCVKINTNRYRGVFLCCHIMIYDKAGQSWNGQCFGESSKEFVSTVALTCNMQKVKSLAIA